MLAAFFALAVVGIDLGRLAFTATEVQTVADIAATAGASALLRGEPVYAHAKSVVETNLVDGKTATIDPQRLQQGRYDAATGEFRPNETPANAVQADAEAKVDNLLAAILDTPETTVEKRAIAAFTTIGRTAPTLPIALGECDFPFEECLDQSCLPKTLRLNPNGSDNSAWTAYLDKWISREKIAEYLSSDCKGGGGRVADEIQAGDVISLQNGGTSNLEIVKCMFCNRMTEFVVPVVCCPGSTRPECQKAPNANFNQSSTVVGFATIEIESFMCGKKACGCDKSSGSADLMNLRAVFRSNRTGKPGGCAGCGTGFIALVH